MSDTDNTKSNDGMNKIPTVVEQYFRQDAFKKVDFIKQQPQFIDFDSMAVKSISWDDDNTNLAGLYVNQLTLKGNGFKKQFVCELDMMFNDKTRRYVHLRKSDVEKLIKALVEIYNNMR